MAVIAIHGGAGAIAQADLTDEAVRRYGQALYGIVEAARDVLEAGGSALDAVSLAVVRLEDNPLFNAGYGAVLTSAGTHELDASIMDGRTRASGAVAGVRTVKNPVLAARAVMEKSAHVLFAGQGAEDFAARQGLERVAADYFTTPERQAQLAKARNEGRIALDHDVRAPLDEGRKMGTVGAVALDRQGNLAAATSTGGMTNKQPGRIGDSPLIGAGCYADNATCAVSCTGSGEMFIRAVAAYDVAARMAYGAVPLEEAAEQVIFANVAALGGTGGLIAVDRGGHIAMPFNSEGMYRGFACAGGRPRIAIHREWLEW